MNVRNKIMRLAATVVVGFAAANGALAQTPLGSEWTYQGKLNVGGSPLNDTADFEFTLWDAEVGPNMIGAVVPVDNVTVVDGQFTVEIDFGAIAFNGDKRWLEIAVRSPAGGGEFTTLDPRQPLTAAPYALQTRGIFVSDDGKVGIGTTAPERSLHIVGDLLQIERAGNSPGVILKNTGNGSIRAGWFLETTGSNTGRVILTDATLATRVIYLTDGKMGVGTGAPANELSVVGDADFTGNVGIGTTTPATELEVVGTATATAFVGDGSGLTGISGDDLGDHTATQNLAANGHWLSNDGDDEGLFVTDAGNVGIGTATPPQKLSVFDGELVLKVADNANDQSILFQNAGVAHTWRLYRSAAGGNVADFHIAGGGPALENFTDLPDRLTIDTAGNVGIGTSNPRSIFQVRRKPILSGAFNAETTAGALLTSATDNGGNAPAAPESALILAREGVADEAWANYARFDLSRYENVGAQSRTQLDLRLSHGVLVTEGNNTPTIMSLQSGGNVGIGTSDPESKLSVRSENHQIAIVDSASDKVWTITSVFDNDLGFFEDGTVGRLVIQAGGNVGIGTSTPQAALHVRNDTAIVQIDAAQADGTAWTYYSQNNTLRAAVGYRDSNAGLTMFVNGADRMILRDSGEVETLGQFSANCVVINGGCDLAEPFEVTGASVEPGMLVSIDPENPGQLRLTRNAYDTMVAGVASGAGGLNVGMTLSQEGMFDQGQPVALVGRVYCWADASHGPIRPGDLLTSSDTPGHAMKVTDRERASGAMIGKAMSPLKSGTGLVLVLVNLQ